MPTPLKQRIKEKVQNSYQSLQTIDAKKYSWLRKFGISFCQSVIFAVRKFISDKCMLHAAALSYAILIAMIPVLAIAFAVSQTFGAQERFMAFFDEKLADYPEQFTTAFQRIMDTIQDANYAAMSAVGVLLLFWVAVRVLSKIENTFNVIWGASSKRGFLQRFSTYVSIVVIVPFLVMAAASAGAALSSDKLENMLHETFGPLVAIYQLGAGFAAIFALVSGFTMLYIFMPNVRVRFSAAASGGLVGGVLWFLVQWAYVSSQVGMTRLNPVYGAFAAVPLFLAWIFVSWVILLIGAEFGYGVQQHGSYAEEVLSRETSHASKEGFAFLLMYDISRAFCAREEVWCIENFIEKFGISSKLVNEILTMLADAGLVVPVSESEFQYVPATDPELITGADVVKAVEGDVVEEVNSLLSDASEKLHTCFEQYKTAAKANLTQANFRKLVQH